MASPNITITLQAAGDSVMTEDNAGGTALTEDDCRKAYGLPHTYVAAPVLRGDDEQTIDEYRLIMNDRASMTSGKLSKGGAGHRWDEISPISVVMLNDEKYEAAFHTARSAGGYGMNDTSITGMVGKQGGYTIDRRPTTTAFQLRCDTYSHDAVDMSSVTPLPGMDWGPKGTGDAGTPEQLDNFGFGMGLRKETITLGGVMIDRGIVSAANPRRQILLNIARTQYLKIRNAFPPPTAEQKEDARKGKAALPKGRQIIWGGRFAGPTNPRSYPCLTIFNQDLDDHKAGFAAYENGPQKGDVEPDGAYKIYRGIIQSLSFSMEAGRPDFWRWQLKFDCITNEKRGIGEMGESTEPEGADGEDAG